MRRDWFVGKSQEWLEAELAKAQEDLSAGSMSTGGAEGEASFTETSSSTPQDRIDRLLYSLYLRDPEAYPPSSAKLTRITKTVFNQ